jgi:hypothetical protein
MDILVQPSEHMGAYSAIPLRVYDTDVLTSDDYKYLVNILWNKVEFSSTSSANINGVVYTTLVTDTPHSFRKGETVFVNDDSNGNEHSGYYILKSIISDTIIAIDELWGIPFGPSGSTVSRVVKYKLNPDLEGECKLDLSNSLKDFVSQNLDDTLSDLPFSGNTTRFDYDLSIGSESRYVMRFDDNIFYSGALGFVTSEFVNVADVPFNVGDQINVAQDIVAWTYTDNYFCGYVGYTGTTNHNFLTGQTIEVVGQITNPQYNGIATITAVDNTTSLCTNVPYGNNTGLEPGTIYGTPRPSYNGTATITDIVTGAGSTIIIVVNKSFGESSAVIGGDIRYADNRLTTIHNEAFVLDLRCYNAHINRLDYTVPFFEQFYIEPINCSGDTVDKLSTLLLTDNTSKKYRIEPSTKSFLLSHTDSGSTTNGLGFDFYDSGNNLIGQISQQDIFYEDMYSPIGIEQLATNLSNYQQVSGLTGGDFTSYSGSVDNYSVYGSTICNCCECDLNIHLEYKDLTSEDMTAFVQPGLINGNNFFYFTLSGSPAQLAYMPSGIDSGWYMTEQGVTEYSGITTLYAFDKNNETFCPAGVFGQEWSAPIPSPVLTSVLNEVTFLPTSIKPITKKIWFEINDDCSDYEVYHLMWKDRYGSWLSYPFIYFSKDFTEVERSTFYKTEGNWDDNTFGYDPYGRGESQYFGRSRDKVTVNSGWIKDYENLLIKDLLESTSVYLQDTEGRLLACIIEEKELELKKNNQVMIYNYKMTVRLSNNEVRF